MPVDVFAHPRDHRAVTRLENVRQLNMAVKIPILILFHLCLLC